ncbi:MAG: type I methionyl aminopeptidase [Candidatus Latescibacteria bacterium]|nr:type I methionyl aminopeptidase [bacterium]MBD3425442.1 type I methionyl aminopeptidase [Candidatus Latescibacterota bacterium]
MIRIKKEFEIEQMRRSARILHDTFDEISRAVEPGITTGELDRIAEEYIIFRGGKPAFKGYQGFPATICASINDEVVHGIPGERKLEEGDIVGIDMGVINDGYYSDATRSYAIGKISDEAEHLLKTTMEALDLGIDMAREGNHLSDISHAIQEHSEKNGYQVVRSLVGHGIGRELHEEPQIPNFGPPGQGPVIKRGMVFAIEPMLNAGTRDIVTRNDRWTTVTRDGKLSCHFEDTIAVTDGEPEILTR